MIKIKITLKLSVLALLAAGSNSYAACIANVINTSNSRGAVLISAANGDCVENSGTITTTIRDGHGILSYGSNTTNINSGGITTSGDASSGILASEAYTTNINSGVISISGFDSKGIFSTHQNSINNNLGTILTSGYLSYGLYAFDSYSENNNAGVITTTGADSGALYSVGASSTNTNSGTITTSGINAIGITSYGIDSSNNNSGLITTSGSAADGIASFGANTTNNNSGTITTSLANGYGIYSGGAYTTNTNSGSIATNGNDGLGIYSTGTNATINNLGTIATSGNRGDGIYSLGADTITTNSGVIMATGANSRGIVLAGNNQTFTNSGLVMATGANSNAISWVLGVSNGVVNLNRGSVIIGDMVAGNHANARLNINLGSGVSYAYSVSSHVLVSDLDNRPMVTGSAYAAGIGAQETASEMLYQRTSSITSALDRRLRSYASNEVDNQPYWLDVYYSDVTRNSGGNYSTQTAFSNYNYGMTAGFKLPVELTTLELLVNVQQSNLNIESGNQKIDSTSLMAGVSAPNIIEVLGARLSAKALVGYADHDGDRKVMTNSLLYNGSRQIKSDYNSAYAVLGAALTKLYPFTDRLTADVILGLDLNTQRFESYKETDYFAWDSRTLMQLHSRVQTGLDYKLWGDKGSVFARVGAEHRDLIGGATQDYSINGTNVSFNTNNKNDTYLTAQVGIKAQLEKRIQLFGIVNTLHSSDSVNSVSGNIGLRADF